MDDPPEESVVDGDKQLVGLLSTLSLSRANLAAAFLASFFDLPSAAGNSLPFIVTLNVNLRCCASDCRY